MPMMYNCLIKPKLPEELKLIYTKTLSFFMAGRCWGYGISELRVLLIHRSESAF